jgi:RNA polymerase sigma-70 factor (ECF subfamily)
MDQAEQSLTALLEELRPRVRRYLAAAVRDATEAEDLTQETMVRAWRAHTELRDRAAAAAWTYRIATNLLVERARARRRQPLVVAELDDLEHSVVGEADHASDPTSDVVRREMSTCVRALAADVSEAQRAALLLHDAFGLSNPEIAEILGCSLPAVKIRLHRARAHMAKLVDRHCDVSPDERGVLVCERRAMQPIT